MDMLHAQCIMGDEVFLPIFGKREDNGLFFFIFSSRVAPFFAKFYRKLILLSYITI